MYDMYGNGMRENKFRDRIGLGMKELNPLVFFSRQRRRKTKTAADNITNFCHDDEDENSGVFIDKTTTVAKT